jgi:hypothetical protein
MTRQPGPEKHRVPVLWPPVAEDEEAALAWPCALGAHELRLAEVAVEHLAGEVAATELDRDVVAGKEGAEGAPDGRVGRSAPDDEVDEEAVAGHHILLLQRAGRQTCTHDGDAPPLERVAFGSRRRWRWSWRQRRTRHVTSRV